MNQAHANDGAEAAPKPEQTIGLGSDESGLVAFAALLAMHRIAVDPAQLRHGLGHYRAIESADLLRLSKQQSKEAGIRARAVRTSFDKLERMPLPALANGPNGWFLIGRVQGGEALIQLAMAEPGGSAPPIRKVDQAALEAIWSGELVMITTRESAGGQAGRFDVTWFIPQIVKYRRLIGEVLLITLALNLLGLAAPLFFQNVVDKVLVHDTLDTLTVLAIGYVAVSVWETAFGWLRTRLYSRTSQKIDVELGAKLFRHLLGLPIGYFEARRVGDIAMRVRQLETIREFLTNASLTVLVDPAFTVVFLVVMWIYSVKLFVISVLTIPAYIAVALFVTRPLRSRIEEKFERGAANNALLIESIGGIQTVKAGAVEPQWQDRWERQLAGYSMASQRVIDLGNSGSQLIQLISKLNLAAILYFGAEAVIHRQLTVGGLVAFNMFAQRVSGPVIRMAQLWQDFQQVRIAIARLGDVLNQPTEPGADQGRHRVRRGQVPLWPRRPVDAGRHYAQHPRRNLARHRRLIRLRQIDPDQAPAAALRAAGRAHPDRRGGHCPDRSGLAAAADRRGAAGEPAVQPLDPREYRAVEPGHAARSGGRGGDPGWRPRIHRALAAGLRYAGGRARLQPVRRPAPAPGDRPRAGYPPANFDPRRGNQRARRRE